MDRSRRQLSTQRLKYTPLSEDGYPASSESENGSDNPLGSRNVVCPSCKGAGYVPKDRQSQLVALIPMTDKRLKRPKTIIYVVIATILCLLLAFLIGFFLYPRGFRVSTIAPDLIADKLVVSENGSTAQFNVTNLYNVSNDDYYSLTLKEATVIAMALNNQLATSHIIFNGTSATKLAMRETREVNILIPFIFTSDSGLQKEYIERCRSMFTWRHNILMELTLNMTGRSSLGREESVITVTYQTINCNGHKVT